MNFLKDLIINLLYVQTGTVQTAVTHTGAPASSGATAAGTASHAAGKAVAQAPQGGMMTTLIFFGVMILIFYLLIFRPQQKRTKKHQSFLSALRSGDRIITASGIYGTVYSITENVVEIEVAKNVKIRMLKNQIATFQASAGEGGAKKDMENIQRGTK